MNTGTGQKKMKSLKSKIKSKRKFYRDFEGLRLMCKGMEMTEPRMRQAQMNFLHSKYISNKDSQ